MTEHVAPAPPPAEPDAAAFDMLVESLGRWVAGGPEWPPATQRPTGEPGKA